MLFHYRSNENLEITCASPEFHFQPMSPNVSMRLSFFCHLTVSSPPIFLLSRKVVSLFVREVLRHEHSRPLLLPSSKTDSFSSVSFGCLPKTRRQSLLHDLWVHSLPWVRNRRAGHHGHNLCRDRGHGIHHDIHYPRWLVRKSRSSSCALRF